MNKENLEALEAFGEMEDNKQVEIMDKFREAYELEFAEWLREELEIA